ncbi:MAG: hypothetical protein A3G33_00465 [Omnitrophica bacterium RIFCSPLOWO2_12_FULL_44_17]|uniref:Uncharacterized protein n=1 Tax=Candidatus Danuiimicrobium aquiferis TaxID=1801832 RepID=A0A1G1KTF1_9BACT|nr:MAG: hypothetical protein A3B72_08035 [Omnitrophica bacterium RIFCSPHIGHO2_02_FULL_45_28]OGW95849.1 MAG: hypothetical protein A3G33_00465 [Omnitrophica bacterium RIFCSPLOWO2_12_FULL_44_17]OGX01950.1 MAG: hypothetical protein A3J12_01875 [Omnitrophica bacterium RIFCSPLOWO2_02_FULL_44_11]
MKTNMISKWIVLMLVASVPFLGGCSTAEKDQLQNEVNAFRSQMGILQAKSAEEVKQCQTANAQQMAGLKSAQAEAEKACQGKISQCEKDKEQLSFELDKARQDFETLMKKKGANMSEPSRIK